MTAVAVIAGLALLLLAPLVVSVARQRSLLAMATRNIRRRRAEAALVVAGALLGTAIITSSFVVGDVIEGSFSDVARTQLGPVDITITPAVADDIDAVTAMVEGAGLPAVDGLLAVTTTTATLEATGRDAALPQVQIAELDVQAARAFGPDPTITGVAEASAPAADEVIVNAPTAARLDVVAGDTVGLHAHGSTVELVVSEVVPEVGLAGYGGALVAPGTIRQLAGDTTDSAAPPQARLLVSLVGGVLDTRELSDPAVQDLRRATDGLTGAEITATKASVLDDAQRDAAGLTQVFTMIGSFSVIAGILLLVNLFVMLAEERKTELGMLRAVGFTRRRLTRAFAVEGAIYAITAAVAGAAAGVGIGWVVAVVAGPIFGAAEGTTYPLVIDPASLAIGAGTGLVISLVTIWATSLRIARLNIIRAIRDLPEPTVTRVRARTVVLGAVGIVAGAALAVLGYAEEAAIPLVLGVPLAAFCAGPLLRRLLPERAARLAVAGTVLGWGLAVYPLFPDILGAADMLGFVVQGVVLTTGAVSLASSLDHAWTAVVELLGRGGRGLAPRLGIAYPLARRFRTAMLLGMFSLVIFTVTILSSMSASMEGNTAATVDQLAGGFDVLVDANPASPIPAAALTERDDVREAASLVSGTASFSADHLDTPRDWTVSGFDEALVEGGPPGLFSRDEAYATDADVYRAVLADPTLAIVPENFLVAGIDEGALRVGDTFEVIEPSSGATRELTIAGLTPMDQLDNGALVSRELTRALGGTLGGAHDVATRSYLALADGADPDSTAAAINAAFLRHGAQARTFTVLGGEGVQQLTGFIALLQGFLGLGLLVGIAGLGVVMVRAVRERRHEIGMLRAMGFRAGLVRVAMLSEAGLIAVQGTVIGALLGLVTTRQLLTGSESFGDVGVPFVVPWGGLLIILVLPLAASLAATAWPASRAAAIRPAIALRATD
ncbi:MAG: FtsX-like permease family protein [Egibacteraceae bacterium]